jgi:hypothetical protein
MKRYQFVLLVSSLLWGSFPTPAYAVDEIASVIQEELKKEQTEVQTEYVKVQRRVHELQAQKGKSIVDSKRRGEAELLGSDLLKKFMLLMTSRYRNERSEFESGLELNAKDLELINKVFAKYLFSHPLQGRVSAGEARRTLDWGVKRLQELAKIHAEPTEQNNPDLEILTYQLKISEISLKRVGDLAKALGVNLTEQPRLLSSER